MSELWVRLEGEAATLGKVSAADVAQLIISVEKAASRAAAVALGRPKTSSGRYQGVVERSVDFRLRSIEQGSVVAVLELPPSLRVYETPNVTVLDLQVASLGETAVKLLLDAGDAEQLDPEHAHPLVADALLDVADRLHIGERYEAIVFETRDHVCAPRTVRVDSQRRELLRSYVQAAGVDAVRPNELSGVLFEADFEKNTARLRTPSDVVVEVSFAEDHADEIQAALRQHATARGDVVYDANTHAAKSVRLRRLVSGEQLVLGVDAAEFWAARSFAELAEQQGAGNPVDPEELFDDEATDDEKQAFMAALAELD